MAGEPLSLPAWQNLTDEQSRRWIEVLAHVADTLPTGAVSVVIDGGAAYAAIVADRLADTLHASGRPCARLTDTTPLADEDNWRAESTPDTIALADGARWRAHPPTGKCDVVVWLRTPPVGPAANGGRGPECDIIIDLHDPTWPVIRQLTDRLARTTAGTSVNREPSSPPAPRPGTRNSATTCPPTPPP
jgi:hypothetical protein